LFYIYLPHDECTVVEPGCGAALAAVYRGMLARLHEGQLPEMKPEPVVVIVCRGCRVSLQLLKE
jgi:L-serine/L-threonine ammonia-lyase